MIEYKEKHKTTPFILNVPASTKDFHKIAKHQFTAKVSFARQRYHELDIFRHQIEQSKAGLHHQPYTYNKKCAVRYKLAFFGFSAVFLTLAFFSLSLSATLGCGLFFNTCGLVKNAIFVSCLFLSFCSFFMALTISNEREAVMQCIRKSRTILTAIYARKRVRLGIKGFAFFGAARQKSLTLKHAFNEISDKINDKKDETLHLVHRISNTHTLDKAEKEDLLNQAIEELNEKLMTLTHNFRHTHL